jgi:hypothetical protein
MNPSTMHSRTPARGLRRTFLLRVASGLLAVLLAAPAPALAQNLIQFSVGSSTFTRYEVKDDGTGLRTLPLQAFGPHIYATTRSYPLVGRLFTYPAGLGNSNNVFVWCEATGQSKAVTDFQSPLQVLLSGMLWSNDGQDSFVSFLLSNSATGQSFTYRAHVSAADIAWGAGRCQIIFRSGGLVGVRSYFGHDRNRGWSVSDHISVTTEI